MLRKEKKTAEATFWVKLTCDCPHCTAYLDLWDIVDPDELPNPCITDDTDIIVNCPECEESFTVTRVTY